MCGCQHKVNRYVFHELIEQIGLKRIMVCHTVARSVRLPLAENSLNKTAAHSKQPRQGRVHIGILVSIKPTNGCV
jgi:hypothetical protein